MHRHVLLFVIFLRTVEKISCFFESVTREEKTQGGGG